VHPHASAPALAIREREETLGISNAPAISSARGPNFDGSFVRSRYGPPGCSPPGLIRPSQPYVLRLPQACTSGLPAFRSPQELPDMTTAPNGELRRQDLHLQVQQLVSLRSLLEVLEAVSLRDQEVPGNPPRWADPRGPQGEDVAASAGALGAW
jgi:hypothetical protein